MKKIINLITIVAVLFSMAIAVSASDYDLYTEKIGTAEYAAIMPVIDGEVDDVWYDTYGYKTTGTHFASDDQIPTLNVARAEIRVLWTEDALYFLAIVDDSTLPEDKNCTANCVNFWVSENNTLDVNAGYAQEPGDWFFCVNHHGTILPYDSNGELPTVPDAYAVTMSETGYIVEFKMSVQSEGLKYSAGHIIGFNVSCDDEFNGDSARDHYNNLNDTGAYWSKPAQMPHLCLVKTGCTCEVRCEGEGDEACPLCSVNIAHCSAEETDSTEPSTGLEPQETGLVAWFRNLIEMIIAFFANLFG